MNYEITPVAIVCPYCGEQIDILVDQSIDEQDYIEDCSVCCRPIALTVRAADTGIQVIARTENE